MVRFVSITNSRIRSSTRTGWNWLKRDDSSPCVLHHLHCEADSHRTRFRFHRLNHQLTSYCEHIERLPSTSRRLAYRKPCSLLDGWLRLQLQHIHYNVHSRSIALLIWMIGCWWWRCRARDDRFGHVTVTPWLTKRCVLVDQRRGGLLVNVNLTGNNHFGIA